MSVSNSMRSFVQRKIEEIAIARCKIHRGSIIVHADAVLAFIGALSSDIDTSWVFKRPQRFFAYGVIQNCLSSYSGDWYEVEVFKACLVCLNIPDSGCDWDECAANICQRVGLPASTRASTPEAPPGQIVAAAPESEVIHPALAGDPYATMTKAQLIAELHRRDHLLKSLRAKLKSRRRHVENRKNHKKTPKGQSSRESAFGCQRRASGQERSMVHTSRRFPFGRSTMPFQLRCPYPWACAGERPSPDDSNTMGNQTPSSLGHIIESFRE